MNKNLRIITINGFRGILMILFIISGLIAGFIISPSWVCMKLWNTFVASNFAVASMNLYQGMLLWIVIVLSLYALNNKRSLVGFGSFQRLTNDQIKDIIKKSKLSNEKLDSIQNIMKEADEKRRVPEKINENEQQDEIRG